MRPSQAGRRHGGTLDQLALRPALLIQVGGSSPTAQPTAQTGPGTFDLVPEVAARLQSSVVTILTAGGSGSGVVYDADGLIVTNEHVVRGSTAVEVAFAAGQRVPGTVLATDVVTDLALVEADRTGLPEARFQTDLTVSGAVKEKERTGILRRHTRRVGQFQYSGEVDADRVSAQLDEGVLTVRVPKPEQAKPRRITIST